MRARASAGRDAEALAYFEILLEKFWDVQVAPDGKLLERERKSRAELESEGVLTES